MEKQCGALREQLGEAHDQIVKSDANGKDAMPLQSELTETEPKLVRQEAQATAEIARQSMAKFESELHTLDRAKTEVQRELQETQERASATLMKFRDDSTKTASARRDSKEAEEAVKEVLGQGIGAH